MTLNQSIYLLVSPIFMLFAVLACAGTPLLDVPSVTCPTPVQPTALPGTGSPTPVVITDKFYIGDKVIVGNVSSLLRVQFRLLDVNTYPTSPDAFGNPRQIVSWRLRVKNIGTQDYEIFPALQMFVSEVDTAYGTQIGMWGATQAAGDLVGQIVDNDIYTLIPDQTHTFRLVAFAPAGTVQQFGFVLDPTADDSSTVLWSNRENSIC